MSDERREPEPESDPDTEDEVGGGDEAGKDEVEEQSEESFPASDPPSY